MTHFENHGHEAGTVETEGFFIRLLGAGMAVCFYLGKFLWPTGFLPDYPRWVLDPPSLVQILPIPLLMALGFGLWTWRGSWGRHVLLGFGFFLINLLPVLVFIVMNYDTMIWSMDHLVYLPIIGLIGLAVAAMGQAEERLIPSLRPVGVGVVAVVMIFLAWESHGYAGLYINSETLWNYTLQRNPQAYLAHNNLGSVLDGEGRINEAMEQFEQALQIKPDFTEAHNNLGYALQQSGRMAEAIKQYQEALRLKPDFAEAHYNLGNTLLLTGRMAEAIQQYQEALRLKPDYAEAHGNMGFALQRAGRISEAITQYEQALQLKPDDPVARNNLPYAQALQKAAPAKK
jgi:tetratricopeptide (TPR) repeat protein